MPDLIRHPLTTWIALTVSADASLRVTMCPAFAGMTTLEYLIAGLISLWHYDTKTYNKIDCSFLKTLILGPSGSDNQINSDSEPFKIDNDLKMIF